MASCIEIPLLHVELQLLSGEQLRVDVPADATVRLGWAEVVEFVDGVVERSRDHPTWRGHHLRLGSLHFHGP